MSTNQSTLHRLRELPPVFTGSQAGILFGKNSKSLSQALWRWSVAGLIKPLGGKSDVFFNLFLKPEAEGLREQAIALAMPQAILGGASILMESGASTQFSRLETLIVPDNARYFTIDGAMISVRPRAWIEDLDRAGAVKRATGLPRLTPGSAIADLLLHEPLACPDPDDIDWNQVEALDRKRFITLIGGSATKIKSADQVDKLFKLAYHRAVNATGAREAGAAEGEAPYPPLSAGQLLEIRSATPEPRGKPIKTHRPATLDMSSKSGRGKKAKS